jgi:ankyrin repeat protein
LPPVFKEGFKMKNQYILLLLLPILLSGCDKYKSAQNAVVRNDFSKFRKIVDSQEDEIVNEYAESLLHLTVQYDRYSMTELLIDKGYSLNRANVHGITPLAYSHGNIDIAKLLVENGAQINTEHWHPINTAILNDKIEVVRYFLDKGADLHLKDRNGSYPIHYAVEESGSDIVELLVPNYSFSDITEGLSHSVINRALRRGNPKIIKPVVSKLRQELAKSDYEITFYAINSFNIDLVKYLVENGEDMTVRNKTGETLLEYAIRLTGEDSEYVAAIKGEPIKGRQVVVHKGPFPAQPDVDQPQMVFIFVPPRVSGVFTYSHCKIDLPGEAYPVYEEDNQTRKVFKDVPSQLERPLIAVFTVSKQEETYMIEGSLKEKFKVQFKLVDWKGAKAELVVKDTGKGKKLPREFVLEGDFSFKVTAIDHLESGADDGKHVNKKFD